MKILRTVNVIVLNSTKTKICLLKRESDDILLRKWSFPGQAKKKDDDDLDIAKLIMKKELGVECSDFTFFKRTQVTTKNSVIKSSYYITSIKDPIDIDSRKYSEYSWEFLNEELMFVNYSFDLKPLISDLLVKYKN